MSKSPQGSSLVPKRFYTRVGKICLRFPEAKMKPFGGHTTPAYRVRDKIFCGTTQSGRPSIQFKGAPGAQEALVSSEPGKFFVPAYVGAKGWIGAYLDVDQDWDEISELLEESYRMTAPKKLVRELDEKR